MRTLGRRSEAGRPTPCREVIAGGDCLTTSLGRRQGLTRGSPSIKMRRTMGRNDNRRTLKMRRKKSQAKLKARIKRKIDTARAAKKPAAPSKKK